MSTATEILIHEKSCNKLWIIKAQGLGEIIINSHEWIMGEKKNDLTTFKKLGLNNTYIRATEVIEIAASKTPSANIRLSAKKL